MTYIVIEYVGKDPSSPKVRVFRGNNKQGSARLRAFRYEKESPNVCSVYGVDENLVPFSVIHEMDRLREVVDGG